MNARRSNALTLGLVVLALAGLGLATGCKLRSFSVAVSGPVHHGHVHVHDAYCGHYWDSGTWVYVRGHRHHGGCGHAYVGGRWVIHSGGGHGGHVVAHVHGDDCGHVWDGGSWIHFDGHHHHDHCGHHYYDGRWHLRARVGGGVVRVSGGHVHGDACGHVWDGSSWILFTGHRHHGGCGHHYYDGRWHLRAAPSGVIISVPGNHRCGPRCNHYRRGNRWYRVNGGHVHGAGCGHTFKAGVWISF